jgi:hypothetical protein
LNASISAANGYASLRFDFERSEVNVTVQFPSKERLDKAVAEIEKALELTSMMPGYGETKLAGTKRIFYTANRIDAAWFQTAVKLLRELSHTERYFTSCRVYVTSRLTPDFITGRLDEWEAEVLGHWPNVQRVVCSRSSGNLYVNFECDLHREIVWVEVQAEPRNEVERVLENLQKQLGLELAPEQPYRYRRYLRIYESRSATMAAKLKTAIENAVEVAFKKQFDKAPVVADAYLTETGDSGYLTSAQTLQDFLARLTELASGLREAKLYLEGPRGSALGIFANIPQRRLELRSSLAHKIFEQTAAQFEDALELTLKKKETQEKDKKETAVVLPWMAIGISLIAPVFSNILPTIQPVHSRDSAPIARPKTKRNHRTSAVVSDKKPMGARHDNNEQRARSVVRPTK